MANAAASKIENGKQARSITICKKALHASIDLVVKHIVAVKDFLINRPRVKKILFGGLRHGFALLIAPLRIFVSGDCQIPVQSQFGHAPARAYARTALASTSGSRIGRLNNAAAAASNASAYHIHR